jgi:prepilin-type N-terminal cleavage/methylation domain-containing protein
MNQPCSSILNSFKNQGFSLVEVMVALGILGAISLGVMKVGENMNRTSKNMNQQLDAAQLSSKIQFLLRDKEACDKTFVGRFLIDDEDATANGIIDKNDNIAVGFERYGDITVSRMSFQDLNTGNLGTSNIPNPNVPPVPPFIDVLKRTARLRVDLRKGVHTDDAVNRKTTTGTLEIVKFFEMVFFVANDGSNQILGCYNDSVQYVEAACNSLGGELSGGLCRSLHIYDNPSTDPMAATFHGNVLITNQGASGGGVGDLTVTRDIRSNRDTRVDRNLTVDGLTRLNGELIVTDDPTTLGSTLTVIGRSTLNLLTVRQLATFEANINANANMNVAGQLCLKGSCISSWRTWTHVCQPRMNSCLMGEFVNAVNDMGSGSMRVTCCQSWIER